MTHWVHNLDPFIVRFPEGWPLEGVRWYGFAYLMGFLVAWALLHLYYKRGRSPLDSDGQSALMTYLILGVLVGGRLGYVLFYALPEWAHDPLLVFRVWEGGMASHGGFLGVLAALWLFAKRHHLKFGTLADIAATLAPPGIFFGRLANFVNGELWGKVSDCAWAVVFPHSAPFGQPVEQIAARHPSQLYEAALEGLFLCAVTQWLFWRRKKTDGAPDGQIAALFLVLYALVRIAGETFREPDAALILGMSRGVFYSLFLLLGGLAYLFCLRRKNKGKPPASP